MIEMRDPTRQKTPVLLSQGSVSECEMCHTHRDELVEVSLYWVCDNEECCKKAAEQSNRDIDAFLANRRSLQGLKDFLDEQNENGNVGE